MCFTSNCQNSGVCLIQSRDGQKTQTCECSTQNNRYLFHGVKCEMPGNDVCYGYPCQNGGECDYFNDAEVRFSK